MSERVCSICPGITCVNNEKGRMLYSSKEKPSQIPRKIEECNIFIDVQSEDETDKDIWWDIIRYYDNKHLGS